MKRIFLVFFIFVSTTMSSSAQVEMSSDINAVKTIDGIVKEVLKLVSGEKGTTRNWEALRNLFLSTATFTVLNNNDSTPRPVETLSLNDFINLLHDEYYEQGYL